MKIKALNQEFSNQSFYQSHIIPNSIFGNINKDDKFVPVWIQSDAHGQSQILKNALKMPLNIKEVLLNSQEANFPLPALVSK